MITKKNISLRNIINELIDIYKTKGESFVDADSGWCIYSSSNEVTLDDECYISEYPEYDDDDNEIVEKYIIEHNMLLFCTDEVIQDVVCSSLYQKENASCEEIFKALLYYQEYDNFMAL